LSAGRGASLRRGSTSTPPPDPEPTRACKGTVATIGKNRELVRNTASLAIAFGGAKTVRGAFVVPFDRRRRTTRAFAFA